MLQRSDSTDDDAAVAAGGDVVCMDARVSAEGECSPCGGGSGPWLPSDMMSDTRTDDLRRDKIFSDITRPEGQQLEVYLRDARTF